MEVDREKFDSLTAIFGRELPATVIREALIKHNNNLEVAVDYLFEIRPESTINPPPTTTQQPQQPIQPQQPAHKENTHEDLRALQNMFGGDLSQSVIATVLHSNSGDISNAVDELLNITSKDLHAPPQPAPPARNMDATRRMEQEIREIEDFKRLQQRMQEEEQRLAEETRKAAEQRNKEREQRILEEQQLRREAELRAQQEAKIRARQAEEFARQQEIRRQELLAAQIQAQEEALKIATQRREMEEERARIEAQKLRFAEEQRSKEHQQKMREQEEAMRRLSLEEEEKRRLAALKEEELSRRRRIDEEELIRRRALEEQQFQLRRAQEVEAAAIAAEKNRIAAVRAQLEAQEEKHTLERERLQKVAKEDEQQRLQEEEARKARFLEEQRRMKEEIRRQFLEEEERRLAQEEEKKRKMEQDQFDESVVILAAAQATGVELTCEVKGDTISVTWNIPSDKATQNDWISISSVQQELAKYEQFIKTKGIDAGSHDFKGLTPGFHVVRFFHGGYVPASTSAPLRIGNEATATAKVEGDHLRINYTPSPNPTRDWIGIYEQKQRNKTYLFTSYGNAAGEIIVQAPRPVGEYEVRVFYAGSDYNEQCKCAFSIVDTDSISCSPSTVEQGATLKAEWVMRTKEPSSYNWIGLYPTDETDNTKYHASAYISTATVGSSDIVVPKDLAPGCYELRLFVHSVGKYITYKSSNFFYVVAAVAK